LSWIAEKDKIADWLKSEVAFIS